MYYCVPFSLSTLYVTSPHSNGDTIQSYGAMSLIVSLSFATLTSVFEERSQTESGTPPKWTGHRLFYNVIRTTNGV